MHKTFKVGLTRDFHEPDAPVNGSHALPGFGDIGLGMLDEVKGVEWEFLTDDAEELSGAQILGYDALLVLAPRITERTLQETNRLQIIARFGVGYDNIDVEACTRNGVLLTITPDGVRRPVAAGAITLLLALTSKLIAKDRLTHHGRWRERADYMGEGVTGKTLGVVGLGNIGREVLRLAAPLGMRHLAYDPHVDPSSTSGLNVRMVNLDSLLSKADYVIICCALLPETRGLINSSSIELLKHSAYLINVARGPIVDQQALTLALQERRLRGAALDVFEHEPIDPEDPLLKLENVIATPHAIAWTDECFSGIGRQAFQSILDVASGKAPKNIVNPKVLNNSVLRSRLSDCKGRE